MYKLVVFDVDDTLAEIDTPMEKSTIELLQKLIDKGIPVGLASGKPAMYLSGFARQSGLKIPVIIGENGLEVYLGHGFPPKKYISVGITEEQKRLLAKLDAETHAQAFAERTFFQPNAFNVTCFYSDESSKKEIVDFFNSKMQEEEYKQFELFVHSDAAEVVVKGINKGHALRQTAKELGITTNEIIAVGNGSNDIPMFEAVGYSYGINLKPQYQEKANKLFTNVDDAIEDIIENMI